jgi:D-ribose pyranose/furanose isomerase RbsD
MRRDGILNVRLAAAIAQMGHDDIIFVTDAGFPIRYPDDRVIDLAVIPNVPDLFTVLRGIRQEMWVEKFALIEEAKKNNPNVTNGVKDIFPDAEATTMPNSWFHEEGYQTAKFIVRTGAWMPWGNVALFSGIPVVEWFDATGAPVPEEWKDRYEKNLKLGNEGLT